MRVTGPARGHNTRGLHMNRRTFLQAAGALTAGAGALGMARPSLWAAESKGAPHAERLGWRLGCQAWTFNRFSFYEAIDKTAELGLHVIEAYPGQKLSADQPDKQVGPKLAA